MKHGSLLGLLAIAVVGCKAQPKDAPAPGADPARTAAAEQARPAQPREQAAPPNVPFVPPEPWRSSKSGEVIAPPDPAKEEWRVFVNQQRPMQRKTPVWRPLPATESAVVQMPEASSYRCIVTPLRITAEHNDFNTKLLGWSLQRDLLCSADQWRSWTVHPHKLRMLPDGTRKTTAVGEVLFSERDPDQQVRETYVLVRDEPEQRQATTGPPRILPGVPVDDE